MLEHLTIDQYKIMPWKNGQGITSEIKIYPPQSDLTQGNFDWRLSSANIVLNGNFSVFPGMKRNLMIWEGRGINLNERPLLPFRPLEFDGHKEIAFTLIDGPVTDLGVIFNPRKIKVEVKVLKKSTSLKVDEGEHFFFAASESFTVNSHLISKGDCLKVKDEPKIELSLPDKALIIWFQIHHV